MDIKELQDFQRGYVTAMLWANTYGYTEDGEYTSAGDGIDDVGVEDLAIGVIDTLNNECVDFLAGDGTAALVQNAVRRSNREYSYEQAGHDFALTRNGHGAGYWDRGLGEVGEALSELARIEGESNLWVESDGLVYHE